MHWTWRSGLVQTAVVSDESKRCDALSTALFVMGLDDAIQYWREHRDFEMILLAEAVMRNTIRNMRVLLQNPNDCTARSNLIQTGQARLKNM